jgi:hypothetical protein
VKPTSPGGVSNGLSLEDPCKPGIGGGADDCRNGAPEVWHRALGQRPVCHGCGSLDNGDALAEYKQVTVLFADVIDSMDIASAVGAERLLAVWLNETSATSARKSIAGGGTSVR